MSNSENSIKDLVIANQDKIMSVAIPSIKKTSDVWLQRAIVEYSQNKDLAEFISGVGKVQFITKLAKAAQAGLQIGGIKPHCYMIVMPEYKDGKKIGETLRMDITANGLAHACVHSQAGVLEHVPQLVRVYSKDKFSINQAESTFEHDFSPFEDRGELLGWYAKLEYRNGKVEIPHVTIKKVNEIVSNYSRTDSAAWKKSKDEMLDKTAMKQLLKKPFGESEALSMLVDALDDYEKLPSDYAEKEISDRASDRADQALSKLSKPVDIEAEIVPESKPEKPKKSEEKSEIKPQLF